MDGLVCGKFDFYKINWENEVVCKISNLEILDFLLDIFKFMVSRMGY